MKKINISKEELEQKYLIEELSTRDCAKFFNVGQTTIRRLLQRYNIQARTSSEGKQTKSYMAKKDQINKQISESVNNYYRANGNLISTVCPICGTSFEQHASHAVQCCSIECAKVLTSRTTSKNPNRRLELNPETHKAEHINICKICGKEFKSEKIVRFCSDECKRIFYKERGKQMEHKETVICANCGKEIQRIPSTIKEHNFCNVQCMAEYYSTSGMWSGENSPTWKGGDTKHYKGNWSLQRKLARERDNYTCQICGVTENEWHKQLDVHHIIRYREFDDPKEANQLDNLVCLCNKCHSFVHSNRNVDNLYVEQKIQSDLNGDIEHVDDDMVESNDFD